jgi:hypothetical protein
VAGTQETVRGSWSTDCGVMGTLGNRERDLKHWLWSGGYPGKPLEGAGALTVEWRVPQETVKWDLKTDCDGGGYPRKP